MTKGPRPQRDRPDRPLLASTDIPWDTRPALPERDPCAQAVQLELLLPDHMDAASLAVVVVSQEGRLHIVSGGRVIATLPAEVASRLRACMSRGWRYEGTLILSRENVARLALSGKRLA